MEEWMYISTFLDVGTRWRLSGQLHAHVALPPGKQAPVPFGLEAVWVPESVWALWRLTGIEPGSDQEKYLATHIFVRRMV
jgi:hypothetical protein